MTPIVLLVLGCVGGPHPVAVESGDPVPPTPTDAGPILLRGGELEALAVGPAGVLALGRVSGAVALTDVDGATLVLGDLDGERFVARYDHEGHLIGASQLDLPWNGLDRQPAVGWLPDGGARVVAWTDRAVVVGADRVDPTGEALVVVDLDASGAPVAVRRLAASPGPITLGHTAFAEDGSFAVVGSFTPALRSGRLQVDAAPGGCGGACTDGFVLRVGPGGETTSLVAIGGPEDEAMNAVTLVGDGRIVVAGRYLTEFLFGAGTPAEITVPSVGDPSGGSWDAFVAAFDVTGAPSWITTLTAADGDWVAPCGVAVAADGTIYAAGSHEGEQLVVSGSPIYSLLPSDRGFWARYDLAGAPLGAGALGGREESGLTSHRCVTADPTDGVRISWTHDGDATFDLGGSAVVLDAGTALVTLDAGGGVDARTIGEPGQDGMPGEVRDLAASGDDTWLGPIWVEGDEVMLVVDRAG